MPGPPVTSKDPVKAQGSRLVAVGALGPDGVVEVDTEEHGTLAVGVADGTPFALSNVCRHQFAKMGRGQVRDGCLECPWHRARYDVRTGTMVSGPKGRVWGFPPYSKAVQGFGTVAPLRRFPVTVVDGFITLA
jgi:nitrite reductase/ring-hydroxylating ferredoxin subunit